MNVTNKNHHATVLNFNLKPEQPLDEEQAAQGPARSPAFGDDGPVQQLQRYDDPDQDALAPEEVRSELRASEAIFAL